MSCRKLYIHIPDLQTIHGEEKETVFRIFEAKWVVSWSRAETKRIIEAYPNYSHLVVSTQDTKGTFFVEGEFYRGLAATDAVTVLNCQLVETFFDKTSATFDEEQARALAQKLDEFDRL